DDPPAVRGERDRAQEGIWGGERRQHPPGLDFPPEQQVLLGAGGQQPAVRREGQAFDGRALAISEKGCVELTERLPAAGVPESRGLLEPGRGDQSAVGREGQSGNGLLATVSREQVPARERLPDVDRLPVTGRKKPAVVGEGDALERLTGADAPRQI